MRAGGGLVYPLPLDTSIAAHSWVPWFAFQPIVDSAGRLLPGRLGHPVTVTMAAAAWTASRAQVSA